MRIELGVYVCHRCRCQYMVNDQWDRCTPHLCHGCTLLYAKAPTNCDSCGLLLSPDEAHFYEFRCEACESEWHERMILWRQGKSDRELDRMFSASSRSVH